MSQIPQGYLPPDAAYLAVPEALALHNDPIVTPPGAGIGAWFARVGGLWRRSGGELVAIFSLTHLVPAIVLNAAVLLLAAALSGASAASSVAAQGDLDITSVSALIGSPIAILAVFLVGTIAVYFVQSIGYGAATYAVTRRAAGAPVGLGAAFSYGLRRSPGLFGWTLVFGLVVALGYAACIIPGILVMVNWALFGPVFLYEGGSPLGRSARLFGYNRGAVFGRLALTFFGTLALSMLVGVTTVIVQIGVAGSMAAEPSLGVSLGTAFFGVLVGVPIAIMQFTGVLLTYAEQRGHESVGVHQLVAELG